MSNDKLDAILARRFGAGRQADTQSVARMRTKLAGPLPRQQGQWWRQLPGVLLDWQFAPAWPRVAALAGCAALGFAIGLTGVDRPIDRLGTVEVASAANLSAAMFEPEALTGARP